MATKPSMRQLAESVRDKLRSLEYSAFPAAQGTAAEARRVMNLSIPLADLIGFGYVDHVTEDGRWALQESAAWLGYAIYAIQSEGKVSTPEVVAYANQETDAWKKRQSS